MRILLIFLLAVEVFAQKVESDPKFDLKWLDKSVDPCTDFYQYACGNWLKANPIPSDQSRWGRFNELAERNKRLLRDLLETSAAKTASGGPDEKIGAYYSACMDEKEIEGKGAAPLKPELDRIAALRGKPELVAEIVRLHRQGTNVVFGFSSGQDFKNASEVIAEADQGGLGLPERDYYFKTDAVSVETRKRYTAHVQKMFELLGRTSDQASAIAGTVLKMETELARGSLDAVSRRDPEKVYHRMPVEQLQALSPSFDWKEYLGAIGAPPLRELNVVAPEFFQALEGEWNRASLQDWKDYLTWHYLSLSAPLLSKAFVDENFAFYGKTLTGAKELKPRWNRCVEAADSDLGEALGRKYVEATFGAEGKQRMLDLVHNLQTALGQDIEQLTWMTPETKKKALEKLHAVTDKIGYPEQWRDYSSLVIRKGDALGNSLRSNSFEFQRQLNKIGKPVDRNEWFMTPPTVNAYYDPQKNNINFPAGILQPPFFDKSLDDAVNYGGIGAVIGHELTHGFDDQGRQFDAKGDLRDWWTEKDAAEFKDRAQCFVNQYGGYEALSGLNLNGKLTLGENVADNGGLRIAYMALMEALTGKSRGKIDGFTPEQRLFLGWAQVWCANTTSEALRLRTQTDPHSPGHFRANGTVSNMPEFRQAFGCKASQPMVREKACRVW